jgi:hypothetical protein
MEPECVVVVGGGGTRYDCLGGESPSLKSTFTYVFRASPREDSGSHAKRREAAVFSLASFDVEEVGRESGGGFCWSRAM